MKISRNMIMEILKSNEVQTGGIFEKEKEYMKKYNLSEHEIGMIEVMCYSIMHIDKVKDINIEWR